MGKKEGINIVFLIACFIPTQQLSWKQNFFLTTRSLILVGDRRAWLASSKSLQSAEFAFVLHLLKATSSLSILFPRFRPCLARSQGPGGGHAGKPLKASQSGVGEGGRASVWGLTVGIPGSGQAGWRGGYFGAGEGVRGPSRVCLVGTVTRGCASLPPAWFSQLQVWRFDLKPLRWRFCCQGSSGGKSAHFHLFKVSMVRTELRGS